MHWSYICFCIIPWKWYIQRHFFQWHFYGHSMFNCSATMISLFKQHTIVLSKNDGFRKQSRLWIHNDTLKTESGHDTKFVIMVKLEVGCMKTSCAASDDNIGNMTTRIFQCLPSSHPHRWVTGPLLWAFWRKSTSTCSVHFDNSLLNMNTNHKRLTQSPPGQNGHCLADDKFRYIFMNEKFCILIEISLKFVPNGPINNKPPLVSIMAWHRIGDKPLSEPMLTQFTDAYMRH